ncbi:MAG: peptidoglycan DD-metalloendopeptidase family protein [Deltaproteobacteria bacterium]|nr:peptidoglycan DD-metalloendopeptidase family protein [Deltaproteobacteria bacterium]
MRKVISQFYFGFDKVAFILVFIFSYLIVQYVFAFEFEKYEMELRRLEDEAGKNKSEIITLEREIDNIKGLIDENRKKSEDIQKEIDGIVKILYFIYIEKKINGFYLKDVEVKNNRFSEYIKNLIIKYKRNLSDITLLTIEYEDRVSDLSQRRDKLLLIKKELDRKIEEIYRIMDMKNRDFARISRGKKISLLLVKEEANKKIDEITKKGGDVNIQDGFGKEGESFRIIWPLREGDVIREFGVYFDANLNLERYSRGIAIKAPFLSEVYSVAAGKVIFSGWLKGYGNTVIIQHERGFISVYSHLARMEVSKDEVVKEGDIIGFVGDTGSSEGVILYFELRKNGKAVNPFDYIK